MINSPDRRQTDSLKWGLFGDDVLPLWVADLDFTSPVEVIAALHARVDHGVFGYARESRELKELLTARMETLYGWKITPEDIILLPGIVSAFNLVSQAVAEPGASVLIQPPVYPPFSMRQDTLGRVQFSAQSKRTKAASIASIFLRSKRRSRRTQDCSCCVIHTTRSAGPLRARNCWVWRRFACIGELSSALTRSTAT